MTDKIDNIDKTVAADSPVAASEPEKTPSRFRRFWGRKRILALAVLFWLFFPAAFRFAVGEVALDGWGLPPKFVANMSSAERVSFFVSRFAAFVAPFLSAFFAILFVLCRRRGGWRIAGGFVAAATLCFLAIPFLCADYERTRIRWERASLDFRDAALNGDGAATTEAARKLADLTGLSWSYKASKLSGAFALELNGDYEGALEAFRAVEYWDGRVPDRHWLRFAGNDSCFGRVNYRLDRRADAFLAYCRLAENVEKCAADKRLAFDGARPRALELAKRRVLFAVDAQNRSPLDPFADYAEFLRFIEAEFERAGRPQEREKAVQFWRDAANVDLGAAPPNDFFAPFAADEFYFVELLTAARRGD